MSARYGSKTRVGERVSVSGRRSGSAGGPVKQPYEEVFLAPGTWTWPGNVSRVNVFMVGGGGGGGGYNPPGHVLNAGAGGGGGVIWFYDVPVTGPVPVTIGAGGTGFTRPATVATAGGSTAFGPLPSTTYQVGGGGAGAGQGFVTGGDAPPIGGGGGGASATNSPALSGFTLRMGGKGGYGGWGARNTGPLPGPSPKARGGSGGGAGGPAPVGFTHDTNITPSSRAQNTMFSPNGGIGIEGFGGGGEITGGDVPSHFVARDGTRLPDTLPDFSITPTSGRTNSGAGGGLIDGPVSGSGGSGYLRVEWFE